MNALFLALAVAAGDAALPATAQAEASSTAPLALEQALDLARANPQLAQAQASVMQARGQVGIARSGFLPAGSAGAKAGWTATNLGRKPVVGALRHLQRLHHAHPDALGLRTDAGGLPGRP